MGDVFTNEELATMAIRRVIFHDVPTSVKGHTAVAPELADSETAIDPARQTHLRRRLTRALGSKSAYPVKFDPQTASITPQTVRAFTKKHNPAADFVSMSQKLANMLFGLQHGTISAGLLCVLDVAVRSAPGVLLLKLEREAGAQLELKKDSHGKKSFSMAVLDNLVLTDGTKLFKTALFVRTGTGEDDFRALACDTQLNVTSSADVAIFWMRFLGCAVIEEPRVSTQRFYDAALRFINSAVTEPVRKQELYEHLHSQMNAEKPQFSPKAFIEDYVPKDVRGDFREHLQDEKVSLSTFTKDTSDIKLRLRRHQYRTEHGAVLAVPVEHAEIVSVSEKQIVVNDRLTSVDRT